MCVEKTLPDTPLKGMSGFLRIMEGFFLDIEGDPPIECRQKRAIFEQTAILAGGAKKERMRVHPLLRCCVLSALARMDLVDAAGAGVSRAWLPSSVTAGEQDKIDPDSRSRT